MRSIRLSSTITVKLLGLSLGIAAITGLEILATKGLVDHLGQDRLPWATLCYLIVMAMTGAGAVLSAFNAALRFRARHAAAALAMASLTLGLGVMATQSLEPVAEFFFFAVMGGVSLVYGTSVTFLVTSLFTIKRHLSLIVTGAVTGGIALITLSGFLARTWIGLTDYALVVIIGRDLLTLGGIASLLVALGWIAPLRLDARSGLESIKSRLPLAHEHGHLMLALYLMLGGMGLNLGLRALSLGFASSSARPLFETLAFIPWSWVGLLVLEIGDLGSLFSHQARSDLSTSLTPWPMERFWQRHATGEKYWAATVGIKSAYFTIDHDPTAVLAGSLPASLLHIRVEEIRRSISDVLRVKELTTRHHGSYIYGAIDPECSISPCVDALNLFACLYLDVGPLVERRIRGLASLFPIIDPGLSGRVNVQHLADLMRRLEWFFFLDHSWADQSMIVSSRATHFDIMLKGPSEIDMALLTRQAAATIQSRNQVWLTAEARERVLQEAPGLRTSIHLSPIDADGLRGEALLFSIRFEHLIPILQRYYGLDALRRALVDFEPSTSHARFISLMSLQISRANTTDELIDILQSMMTVPWNGYREKDSVLKLLITIHDRLAETLSPDQPLHAAKSKAARAAYRDILRAVQTVGYPSQLFHSAYLRKLALRDTEVLVESASSPLSPRFSEAWILLSTQDYTRMGREHRLRIAQFLGEIASSSSFLQNTLAQAKAVDAWASLCRAAANDSAPASTPDDARGHSLNPKNEGEIKIYHRTLESLWIWFLAARVPLEMVCRLVDAQTYASQSLNLNLPLGLELSGKIEAHIASEIERLGDQHPAVLAVTGRMQYLSQKEGLAA